MGGVGKPSKKSGAPAQKGPERQQASAALAVSQTLIVPKGDVQVRVIELDGWLALNVGFPNGSEYFGLVAGQSSLTPAAARGAAGGGTLGGNDVVITWRHDGVPVNVERGGLVLELAKDLSLGTFAGRLRDGTEVRGTFACGA